MTTNTNHVVQFIHLDDFIADLRDQLSIRATELPGILHVPNDLPLVYADNPLQRLDETGPTGDHWPTLLQAADTVAEYTPGGDGSPG